MNARIRILTVFLGLLMLGLVVVVPMTISLAKEAAISAVYRNPGGGSGTILQYSSMITGSVTVTQTETVTATVTVTPTVTMTATVTVTPTVTPTPVPTLKVSVTPTQAKVNETFTFTIEAGNNGAITSTSNVVQDYFPSYIDVQTVTASRGVITKFSHYFVVNIGDIAPSEKITITALVKVNSTLAKTETVANVVSLTCDPAKTITASVNYKVVFQSQAGTGELPLNWRAARFKSTAMMPAFFIMGLGFALLLIMIVLRVRLKRTNLWLTASGILFIILGFGLGTKVYLTSPPVQLWTGESPTPNSLLAEVQPSASSMQRLPAYAFSTPEALVPYATLPDFPIPSPEITITPKPGDPGPDTSAVVRIAIPSIFLDTVVKYVPFDGTTWMISGLREEIAWLGNTSWPGLGGNTGLAGHVTVAGMGDGPFRHLEELREGEVVILYTEKNIYTYHVRESKIIEDSDMSVTSPTSNDQITLITCTNWDDQEKIYLNRLVVFADLVRTEPITIGSAP